MFPHCTPGVQERVWERGTYTSVFSLYRSLIMQLRPDLHRTACPLQIMHFELLETGFSPFGLGRVLYIRSYMDTWWPEE